MFDSLAPVITLVDALWDGWMPLATMAKCIKAAQNEQRDSARSWTAVTGRDVVEADAVVSLSTIPSCGACMHDGRPPSSKRRCGRGNGDVSRCMRSSKALTVELSLRPCSPRCTAHTQARQRLCGAQFFYLLQGGKVVSALPSCGRVVRRYLLSNCPDAPTPGRQLACTACCWASCLVPNALHVWIVFLGKFCTPSLVHVAAALLDVLIKLAPNMPKLDLSDSVPVLERLCLVLQHELSPRQGQPPAKRSLRTRGSQGSPT